MPSLLKSNANGRVVTQVKESSENAATDSTAGLCSTTPTRNTPEATELGPPRYSGQNVGSQWCPL